MKTLVAFTLAVVLAAPPFAQVGKSLGGVVDANTIAEADLAKLPGMTPAIAKAVVAARPFDNIISFNKFLLSQNLTQAHHLEFAHDPGPAVGIRRSAYATITWRP